MTARSIGKSNVMIGAITTSSKARIVRIIGKIRRRIDAISVKSVARIGVKAGVKSARVPMRGVVRTEETTIGVKDVRIAGVVVMAEAVTVASANITVADAIKTGYRERD